MNPVILTYKNEDSECEVVCLPSHFSFFVSRFPCMGFAISFRDASNNEEIFLFQVDAEMEDMGMFVYLEQMDFYYDDEVIDKIEDIVNDFITEYFHNEEKCLNVNALLYLLQESINEEADKCLKKYFEKTK